MALMYFSLTTRLISKTIGNIMFLILFYSTSDLIIFILNDIKFNYVELVIILFLIPLYSIYSIYYLTSDSVCYISYSAKTKNIFTFV